MATFVTFMPLSQGHRCARTPQLCAQKTAREKPTKRKAATTKKAKAKKAPTKRATASRTRRKGKLDPELLESWSHVVAKEELKYEAQRRTARNPLLDKLPPSNIHLSDAVVTELRKRLKQQALAARVAEIAQCGCARFTGVLYVREEITDDSPDGLPPGLAEAMHDPELAFINVPPALARRVAEAHGEPPPPLNMLAVYERFGSVEEDDKMKEKLARERDEDIVRQMKAWSDLGDARRTETDMQRIEGPELFHESLVDMFE